jgi:hypothetical protein
VTALVFWKGDLGVKNNGDMYLRVVLVGEQVRSVLLKNM